MKNKGAVFLFFLIFLSGITNEPLSFYIGKKISVIELVLYVMFFLTIFLGKFLFTKLSKYMLGLSAVFFISTLLTKDFLPSDTYVISNSIVTTYGTRSLMVSIQFLVLSMLIMAFNTFLSNIAIDEHLLLKMIVKATTVFAILGILFYIMNVLGFKVPIIQSNELSYSQYRLYSFAIEPQYAALFMIFGLFTSWANKYRIDFVIILIAIFLTFSSTIFVGITCAIVFFFLFKKVTVLKIATVIPIFLIVWYILITFGEAKINNSLGVLNGTVSPDNELRAFSIIEGIALLKEHWLTGIGWGNFSFYFMPRGEEKIVNLSNIFLRVWVEGGVLGFIMLLSFVFYLFRIARKIRIEYSLILIVYFVYFIPNTTAFLQPYFWFFLVVIEYVYNKNKLVLCC